MDTLEEALLYRLQQLYANGAKDKDLAGKAGCTQPTINRLRNGKAPMGKVAVETIARLFPDIARAIIFGGGRQEANGNTNSHITQSIGGNATVADAGGLDAYRGRLYSAILGLGLDPQTQDRVMQAVRGTR